MILRYVSLRREFLIWIFHGSCRLALNGLRLVGGWALLDAGSRLEKIDCFVDVFIVDGLFQTSCRVSWPIQVWVVLESRGVAAAISIRVPSDEQLAWVTLDVTVG